MKFLLSLSIVVFATQVFAQMAPLLNTRWTIDDQKPVALIDIVPILSAQLHIPLGVSSFQLKEQRSLQGLNFKSYVQTIGGVPVRGAGIRIWADAVSNQLVQMIARVQDPNSSLLKFRLKAFSVLSAKKQREQLDFSSIRKLAGSQLKEIRNFKVEQVIYQQTPVIWLEVFGKDRMMTFAIRNSDGKVIFQKLRYYPRGDVPAGTSTATI